MGLRPDDLRPVACRPEDRGMDGGVIYFCIDYQLHIQKLVFFQLTNGNQKQTNNKLYITER